MMDPMSDTSARLLRLLSLLQTPREWPGSELAERLRVSPRTIRRDIDRLRELGYPVQATMGAVGGYRLAAGKAMPPLLLDDEEAVAIAVGLRTAASHPVDGIEEASVRALAKLEQVLPSRLRHRVGALGAATVPMLTGNGPSVDPQNLVVLAGAVANRERLRFAYRAGDGSQTRRLAEPYRLVAAGRRWYLLAYDNDRDDWRVFRVDRISDPRPTGVRVPPRVPPEQDAAAFITRKLYSLAPTYEMVATLHLPADQVAHRLGAATGDIQPIDERSCRLHGHADTLEWLASRLLMLGCEFEVHEPPELMAYLRALGARATRAAGGPDGADRLPGEDQGAGTLSGEGVGVPPA
jgi:predicted DNA-binding transcriptional regulator YafY